MPTITVKNIPDDIYERLKEVAGANHRSINREMIVCLERCSAAGRSIPRRFWRGHAICAK